MTRSAVAAILLGAAVPEAGGDAMMRAGLHSRAWPRAAWFAAAALAKT